MLSQFNAVPTKGAEAAIRYLAGYLKGTVDHSLAGVRVNGVDVIDSYVDASHHGAKAMHSQSQAGLMIMLNGGPLRWRSTRQPDTSDSPAVSELYAIKEIVKDARLQHWVAKEMAWDGLSLGLSLLRLILNSVLVSLRIHVLSLISLT